MRRNPPPRHLGAFAALVPVAMAAAGVAPSNLPAVDFGRMGSVGLGGSFAGLDWHTPQFPFASGSNSTAFARNGDTVIMRNADGTVTVLGATNDGGRISSLCTSSGTLYIGGEFSSVASTSSPNIVAYSIDQNKFVALDKGLSGPVETVYCDDGNNEVWAGGAFNAPEGSGTNVARWSTQSSGWTAVPFGGLNGRVDYIAPSTDGHSVYFGGEFTTVYADSRNNSAFLTFASLPIAPPNTQTTGNSGYLTPFTVPAAVSQYGGLSVNAGPASGDSNHNNADLLLCPGSGGTWFARDSSVANVQVLANAYMSVAGVRISNSRTDGRAVKTFTLTTLPDNKERKLTFGSGGSCNPHCSLSTSSDVWAQDFMFAEGLVDITGLQITLEDWHGDGAALNYVELLSDGAYASYVQSSNEGVCGKSNSTVNSVGNWNNMTAPSQISGTEIGYMGANVPVDNVEPTSLTLYPFVGSAGYYSMFLVVPGCANIGDCGSRTTADISVFPRSGSPPYIMTIDQRIQTDTTMLIYSGLLDATSGNFNPTVRVALAENPAPVNSGAYAIVASGVQMTLTGLSDGTESPLNGQGSSTNGGGTASGNNTPGSGSTASGTGPGATGGTANSGTSGTGTMSGGTGSLASPTPVSSGSSISGSSAISSTSTTSSAVPSTTVVGLRTAFGVYEWARSSSANANAASTVLANSTETDLTMIGFSLSIAKNASTPSDFKITHITPLGPALFIGGDFHLANSYQNVLLMNSSLGASALASRGLNGVVNAAAVAGDKIYFGGGFTGTANGDATLNYLAQYDPSASTWYSMGGGVDGPVDTLVQINDTIHVTGNFTNVLNANGSATVTGGYAIYDTKANEWASSGVVYGTGSAATAAQDGTFIGGRFLGSSSNSAPGIASLVMKDGRAAIETLKGVAFSNNGSAAATSTPSRRSVSNDLLGHIRRALHIARADALPVPDITEVAPATLAGAYYKNTSASGDPMITIVGGNFTSGSDISGLAFQNSEDDSMTGPSPPVSGVVRALAVVNDTLYVGGANLNVPQVGSGILQYNLKSGAWDGAVPLSGSGEVVVTALKRREDTNTIVAAGNFASANSGRFPCPAVCLWDTSTKQWSLPGRDTSISGGEVSAIDFGDAQQGTLVAGGSFILNGKNVYAAMFSFANNSWAALGSLPGPVVSLAVNDRNLSSIFVHGIDASTSQPYLRRWDGNAWTEQHSDALAPGTVIQQLAFVPLQRDHFHDGNSVMENNRMLMASGDIGLQSGNVSSALYDGAQWHPYLVGSTTRGTLGAVSSLFWSEEHFSFNPIKYLARGLVVLVAMAIATGLILLLILLILLGAYCLRRHERKQQPAEVYDEKDGTHSEVSSTHQLIHESVQTALERSLMTPGLGPHPTQLSREEVAGVAGVGAAGVGAGAGAATAAAAAATRNRRSGDSFHDDDEYAAAAYDDTSDEGRETVMRYDFFGPELQAGELPMRAGQRVVVLDDEQSGEWWYCRDAESGREGVVPATYLL